MSLFISASGAAAEENKKDVTSVKECRIWVIKDINRDEVEKQFLEPIQNCPKEQRVKLLVDSMGGDGFVSSLMFTAVRDIFNRKIDTHIVHSAMSAGVIVALAGEHKTMAEDARIYFHPIMVTVDDKVLVNPSQVPLNMRRDASKLEEMALEDYVHFITKRSKITKKELLKMMKNHTSLSAEEALRYGLVDEIVTAKW